MKFPPLDFRLLRFWSDEFPAQQRLAAWREVLSRMLLRVEVEALSGEPFQVDASLRALPSVRFGVGLFGPSISRRTREMASADNDDFVMVVNTEGPLGVDFADAQVVLSEGDACIFSCRQEMTLNRSAVGRLICLRVERARLSTLVSDIDDCGGHVIRRGNEALRLLTVYLRDLDHNQGLTAPDLRGLVITHIFDLVALVLNSSREGTQSQRGDRPGALRLRAIKKYIADNLDKQDLAIADVAAANQLSPRQVQRLFEAGDTTFSEFMLIKRLQNVHAALTDSRQAHRSVSDIALASGFGDVSYFNRAFRRHYGTSPSQVRRSAAVQL